MAGPVVLSEEPDTLKVRVNDPTKPKAIVKNVRKVELKPTTKDRVIKAFFGPEVDSENLGEFVIKEYAEPTAKRMLNNAAQGVLKKISDAVQVLLFGKVISNKNGPVDYTSYSNPNIAPNAPVAHRLADRVEQFVFSTRQDALTVLEYLKGRIQEYGSTSVLDYYDAIHEPADYMMANRGWRDLSMAEVRATPEGFIIDLPRPIQLMKG